MQPRGLTSKSTEESGQEAPAEFNVQSFIVKVWFEGEATNSRATWHGQITHVPSGKKGYLKDLSEITAFIVPYFEAMGIDAGLND